MRASYRISLNLIYTPQKMKVSRILISCGLLVSLFLIIEACKSDVVTESVEKSTWTVIQDKILTPSCATAGCHSSVNDNTYAQHNLVLAAGLAYENLINKTSKNAVANANGLLRVKSSDYANSLLYHKLDCRVKRNSPNYGSLMPLGGSLLSYGQVDFIKQWIEKGAPKTGIVVDESLLIDVAMCSQTFVPLDIPSASEGFQLGIEPFTVSPNTEREVFLSRATPNTADVFVNKIEMRGRPNSHHFVLYGFQSTSFLPTPNTVRDLYNANGSFNISTYAQMQNHIFLGGGTDVNSTFTFPEGVALKIPPGTQVDLNAHYFNKQTAALTGENYVNLYTVAQAKVVKEAQTINFGNYNFSIPANQRKTISADFTFKKDVTVITLTSHFHKMGEKFIIKILGGARNGEVVYENSDWQHPLMLTLTNPIQLKAGEGLTSVVTYNNTNATAVNFGFTSEDEMNIIFGYYY